jgi:hypothetical protein
LQTPNHWVVFKLRKPGPNPFCIGATVKVRAGERTQIREVRSGGSFLSQSGLRPTSVWVRTPGTSTSKCAFREGSDAVEGLRVDRLHELTLGR